MKFAPLSVRPYQLMCLVCRREEEPSALPPRLREIRDCLRADPHQPVMLRCNVDSAYRYQNPGHEDDTPEGELFNEKRDLDILQRMGLVPGAIRPAWELFQRLLETVPTTRGICAYETETSQAWRGCARATSGAYKHGREAGVAGVLPVRDAAEMAAVKRASAQAVYDAPVLRLRPHHLMCMACFHGGREELAPIAADNLFEAIDVIHRNPQTPVTLVRGCCMICPPCHCYDPNSGLCVRNNAMGLRDQKKDLDVLQRLGLQYGDTRPAIELYRRLFAAVCSTTEICGCGDGVARSWEWSICRGPQGSEAYVKARAVGMGLFTPKAEG